MMTIKVDNQYTLNKPVDDRISIRENIYRLVGNFLTTAEIKLKDKKSEDSNTVIRISKEQNLSEENTVDFTYAVEQLANYNEETKVTIYIDQDKKITGLSYLDKYQDYVNNKEITNNDVSLGFTYPLSPEDEIFVKEIKARLLALVESNNEVLKAGEES